MGLGGFFAGEAASIVAFRFHKASCVVVGTFNIYILHPEWLVRRGVIERGMEVGVETNLTRPGLRLRFPQQKALWSISPDRLSIETDDSTFDCGQMIAKVLRILRETPVFAVGNNVHFRADLADVEHLPQSLRDFPVTDSTALQLELAQRTLHAGFRRAENETINLQVAIKGAELELPVNVHYAVGSSDDPNDAAPKAAERFFADRAETESLAIHFLGVTIDHVGNSV